MGLFLQNSPLTSDLLVCVFCVCVCACVCLSQPIPQLSVMNLSDDAKESSRVALLPGPCSICNLTSNNNHIPRMHSEYNKYHYL